MRPHLFVPAETGRRLTRALRPVTMIVLVRLKVQDAGTVSGFGEGMAALPPVKACLHLAGAYDFLLRVTAGSPQAGTKFLRERLWRASLVEKVQSSLVLKETGRNIE